MENKIKLCDYVAARMVNAHVKEVFLITGGGAMHLNDAFRRNESLRVSCFHHEQAAAIAAEGYYRVVNKPAVLNVTTGPGGINALNGVHGAYVDSIGMIVISGQVKRETFAGSYKTPFRQLGDQEVDIVKASKGFVKYGAVLKNPHDVRSVLDKALFLVSNGRPGPVWIDIPIDVQAAIVDPEFLPGWNGDVRELLTDPSLSPNTHLELEQRLSADKSHVYSSQIVESLSTAKRPVIFLGNGVRIANVVNDILDFAYRLKIPVVAGWNAHDLIANDHLCFVGRPGTVGDRAGNFAVQNADFLLVLGCRLNIRQISYNWKSFAQHAWKAMVDVDPAELEKPTLDFDLKICQDLKDFVPKFAAELSKFSPLDAHERYLHWCRERVQRYPVVLDDYRRSSEPMNPYVFIDEFFKSLPDDAIVVTGNGSACVIGFQAAVLRTGHRLFTNSGSASMGYDLPAAIGSAIANPNSPVFCLAGDGSIMMNLQELQTLITYNLTVKVLIINNQGYQSIRQTQHAYFPDNVFGCGPKDEISFPDFVKVGNAFGIPSIAVKSIGEFSSKVVKEMLSARGPSLIDVHVDPNQAFAPKLASRKLPDGTMISPSLEDMAPFLDRAELASNMITDA
jgi:acetolactate synthase-1/2/3 large subunit